uniref:Uncharacterized protein n=1 Tax=Bicosoecida sp. CB-2014 TaxID=1486930 RepID=A0A7S1CBJ0_9STRA|mmetsp:Transcript_1818/g.5709  ORF Transcript_1818/g.5709 Transcript_1818/m.5709 type:complete len:270 (+) Transcript_1818:279-1088(+)
MNARAAARCAQRLQANHRARPRALPPRRRFAGASSSSLLSPIPPNAAACSSICSRIASRMSSSMSTSPPPPAASDSKDGGDDEIFHVYHFNGLHPPKAGGAPTRLARVRLAVYGDWSAKGVPGAGGADGPGGAGGEDEETREAINQARRVMKILEQKDGLFHVVCSPDGSMEGSAVPPAGRRWRCRDCHLPSFPAWTAINDAGSDSCRECGKHVSVCGYCHWITADELPRGKRDEYARANAPNLLKMMRAKFPRADMDMEGQEPPGLWG